MKVLVFDDKLFFAFEGTLMAVEADVNAVADAYVFDTAIRPLAAEPDQYSTQADLNEFRVALGLPTVEEEDDDEEDEEEDDK